MIRNAGNLRQGTRTALRVSLFLVVTLAVATAPQASAQTRTAAGSAAVGSATWGINIQDPASLDLYTQLDAASFVITLVYETLTEPGPGGSVAPFLATSWKQTGPKTWVFRLRHNVRFSNGREMTARDVVNSFRQFMKAGDYGFLFAPATGATAVGKYAVRFTLSSPDRALPAAFETLFVAPANETPKALTTRALGTGPYVVKSHTKGVSWSFAANPYYWQKGLPHLKTVNVRLIQDEAALGSALRAGTVDFEGVASIDQAHALASSTVAVTTVRTPDFYWVGMNAVSPTNRQFKDPRVRQAVNLAIDRSEMVKIALGGLGQPTGIPTVTWPDGCNVSKMPGGTRDLTKARALMKAAGVGPFSTTLLISPATGAIAAPELAQVLQANLKDIGIKVNIVTEDVATWVDHVFTKGDFSMTLNWFNGEGDPTSRLHSWNPKLLAAVQHFVANDPTLDGMITHASSLPRSNKRTAVFQQICRRIATDANMVPLTTFPSPVAYRKDRVVPVFPSMETQGNEFRYIDKFKLAH